MKYEIDLVPKDSGAKTVDVFAQSHSEAVKMAEKSNPGFRATHSGEVTNEDEDGREIGGCKEVYATCENCETTVFCDDKFVTTADDCTLCEECANAFR